MRQLLAGFVVIILIRSFAGVHGGCNVQNCNITQCNGNSCDFCNDGYYHIGTDYCYPCMNACTKCTSYDQCQECISDKYGYSCQRSCSQCKDQLCGNTECTLGCKDGRYLTNGKLCNMCPTACSKCEDNTKCTECKITDSWGPVCEYSCNNCVDNYCDRNSGCLECEYGYYQMEYNLAGGYNCEKCPVNCRSCITYSNCQSCVSGYWGSYCQHSCAHCLQNTCSKTQGCKDGCLSGFYRRYTYGQYFCDQCPATCLNCNNYNDCSHCKNGYVGSRCQFDCRYCNGWQCSYTDGGCLIICNTTQYYNPQRQICQQCPNGCTYCTNDTVCGACSKGRWGSKCQHYCSSGCHDDDCEKQLGICYKCIDGYHGDNCTYKCLPSCKSCLNGNSCVTCKDGYFGNGITQQCSCDIAFCTSRTQNKCISCSSQTLYPLENGCCPCSSSCKDQQCYTNQTCLDCPDKKFGLQCENDCSESCKDRLCYRDGKCLSCTDGKFGEKCENYCSSKIRYCSTCHVDKYNAVLCDRCNDGWYVKDNKCIYCASNCFYRQYPKCNSTSGECLYGCYSNWYGDFCDSRCNVSKCSNCHENVNICDECESGFFLRDRSSCVPCPDNCNDAHQCNQLNGSCDSGCSDGWSGLYCNKSCYSACSRCDQYNENVCGECKVGFYGNGCEQNCSQECIAFGVQQTCNKADGNCIYGCTNGSWGSTCEYSCGNGCTGSSCNRSNGRCLNPCTDTYYGEKCDVKCSENCVVNDSNSLGRLCNEVSGHCLYICKFGWYGESCEIECSKGCKDRECNRGNGTCVFGCNDGFSGKQCNQALQSEVPDSNTAAIGGGTGAGVAVLIIVIVVMVLFFRKRKASSKLDSHDGRVSQQQKLGFKQTDLGPVYSNIDEASEHKEYSQNPGVSNFLYANASVRMSDLSETGDPATPLVASKTSTRPSSEDYLKEVELEEGEVIDDDDDETDQSGEVDNTYYNVGGKRVAVAQLAEYIKHRSERDLLNDFSKLPTGLLKAHKEARKAKNAAKNRYKAIYPYDENRVVLHDGGGDYMNASYIDGFNRTKEYIASSGPFKKSYETTPDFWRMIWQEKCETIVMLTKPVENKQPKCEKYWPEAGENSSYGDMNISCLTEDLYADFAIRILTVTKGGESFNIHHVHFTAWPDKGIPHDVTSMIEFIQKVRSIHKVKNTPMLVHCSAGIGRTGTFIVLDMLTYEGEDRGSVDIFGSVASLRYQRCNMVQTPEQYVYLHHAVLHSLTFDCRSIPGDMFLQNYNKLIERNGGERKIDIQFQQLQSISEEMTDEETAEKARNKDLANKNRNDADIPADENRVKLKENRKPGSSDYINAVYINSFRKRRKFIAAQSPLPTTVVDFLSLVWQEKCGCIVSMEDPDIQDKTVKVYWPADNQVVKHGVFKVTCKDSKTTDNYMTKKLSITYHEPKGEESRDVNLFIFTNWPKVTSVPKSPDSLLRLIKTVDISNRKSSSEPPILIHCRTGAERSCVFCAVSGLIEKMEIEHELSVVNTLRQIKARRLKAFSTADEYKFCYQAVISYLKSFEIYSNFQLKETEA